MGEIATVRTAGQTDTGTRTYPSTKSGLAYKGMDTWQSFKKFIENEGSTLHCQGAHIMKGYIKQMIS